MGREVRAELLHLEDWSRAAGNGILPVGWRGRVKILEYSLWNAAGNRVAYSSLYGFKACWSALLSLPDYMHSI